MCVEEVANVIDTIGGVSLVGSCLCLAGYGALRNVKGVLNELKAYSGVAQTCSSFQIIGTG